ncbi:Leucine Rich repeats (2 copies) [Rubripirellula tenax]|uniref:Leucine Rich repeats (2 copies) n=1 Tax=Rubripirellula tenax TaxID=2528015 RepID=A0A5C6FHL4_9BACT|nr:hypothetical protein [Rubripirellula tenax]TWU60370.1 Leucine Rich repeats (2 copies) [Rubripirellula tenax]
MYLATEFLFYAGLILVGSGLAWLLATVVLRRWSRTQFPLMMIGLGVIAIATPAIYTRIGDVDLGPRIALVQGEKHITLTGWDGESYAVLGNHPETIVLQMANADVTDQTLGYLSSMANLRELDLNDSSVTDGGMAELSKLTGLQTLRLRATKITDEGLERHLSRLPDLRRLDLRETTVSDEAIEKWKAAGEGRRVFR